MLLNLTDISNSSCEATDVGGIVTNRKKHVKSEEGRPVDEVSHQSNTASEARQGYPGSLAQRFVKYFLTIRPQRINNCA